MTLVEEAREWENEWSEIKAFAQNRKFVDAPCSLTEFKTR